MELINQQKVKARWMRLGDTNSIFYHSTFTWRRARNEMKGVLVDGSWSEN